MKLFDRDTPQSSGGTEIYEQIQGKIEWDETNQEILPLVVIDDRQWSWLELGRELMPYEGFKIKIEIT